MIRKTIAAAILAAGFSLSAANATKVLWTFTGVVTASQGVTPFGSVQGQGYVATYLIDLDAPSLSGFRSDGPTRSRTDGGTGYGLPDSPLAIIGSLTVNGVTVGDLGHYTSDAQTTDLVDDPQYGDQHIVYATAVNSNNYSIVHVLGFNTLDFLPDAYFTTPVNFAVPANSQSSQSYFNTGSGSGFQMTVASFTAQTVDGGSAVPEPSVWAMMIVGFGLVGWQMRRRPAARWIGTAKA